MERSAAAKFNKPEISLLQRIVFPFPESLRIKQASIVESAEAVTHLGIFVYGRNITAR